MLHLIDDHDVTSFVTHSLIPKAEQREKVHNTCTYTCTCVHMYMYMYIVYMYI